MSLYLSRLFLEPATREVQFDLGDCQKIHQRIMSAFPRDSSQKGAARSDFGILFRVESMGATIALLVQSEIEPAWHKLPPRYLTAGPDGSTAASVKRLDSALESLTPGTLLRFRLRANPTKKVDTKTGPDGKRRNGKRVPLRSATERVEWLSRKASACGFEVVTVGPSDSEVADVLAAREQRAFGSRKRGSGVDRLTVDSVLFEGRLCVLDAVVFREAISKGIGPGKAYGCGLLSIAPA